MAVTVNKQSARVDYSQLKETLTTGNATTARNDSFGAGGTLYFLFANSAGSGAGFNYLKLYDTKEQVVTGTHPDYIFPLSKGVNEVFHFPDGLVFSNGVAFAASSAGGTGLSASTSVEINIQMVFK